ncbi:MAG: hypothetical protein OXP28_00930 [Gammaproteobacteria bacterium]|nr:hypothetical protein [Gammaproteobacteria bacterium]
MDPRSIKRLYEEQLAAGSTGKGSRETRRMFRGMLRATRELPARSLAQSRGATWVWSDLHLGHENIIRYTNRPFEDVAEMNARLYANWDAAVGEKDTLVFVGDIAMRTALCDTTWQRIREGPGRTKILVVGNHDLTGSGTLRVDGFDDICSVLCVDGDVPLVFTHMPLATVPDGCANVHGHTHDARPTRSPHINVSVEQLAYRPVPLERIRALAKEVVAGRFPEGTTTIERIANL